MAKRKKLNKRFLTIASSILGGVIVMGVAFKVLPRVFPQVKWLVRGTPAHHIAAAKALYDSGKYAEASEEYQAAIRAAGSADAPLYTAWGDCDLHLILSDSEMLRATKALWDQALSVDPNYQPALQRELSLLVDDAELNHTSRPADQWQGVQTAAEKLLAVAPTDRAGQIAQQRAILARWTNGVETTPERVDSAITALGRIAAADPFDADAFYYYVQGMIFRGVDRLRQRDRAGADSQFAEINKAIDAALASHPDDPTLHYRAAQAMIFLALANRAPGEPVKNQDRIREELTKANNTVKTAADDYNEIKRFYAQQIALLGDQAASKKAYQDLLKERPEDLQTRVLLAEMLMRDAASRQQAAELLQNIPPADPKRVYGVPALLQQRMELLALSDLINAKLDILTAGSTQPQQDLTSGLAPIEEMYSRLTARPGMAESSMGLQARGRIELAKGQTLQAKQTLDRALAALPPMSGSNMADAEQRMRVMYLLAGACIATEQTGQAKDLLAQILTYNNNFTAARLQLIQLLLREGNRADAGKQVAELARQLPADSPLVLRLQIATLDPEKDKARIAELYAKYPETNANERTEKAQLSSLADQKPDAARLLESVLGEQPNNLQVLVSLARLYVDLGNKPKAMTLIDGAVAAHPEIQDLKLAQAEISGADVQGLRRDMIDKIQDPLVRELALHDLAVSENNPTDAEAHLDAAAKIKPDDGRVLDLLFRRALAHGDWQSAADLTEKLAAMNQDMANGALYRVRLALARGDKDRAFALASKLTADMPGIAQSWVVLGQVQRAQGRASDAIGSFATALQKQSNNLDAIREMIGAYYDLNQPASAVQYIQMGRQMFPRSAAMREIELNHELRYGDAQKVIEPRRQMLQKAIADKTANEQQAWLDLGNAYLTAAQQAKDPASAQPLLAKAADNFKAALDKFPDELAYAQLFAETSLKLGHFADGEAALKQIASRPLWAGKAQPTLVLADYYFRGGKPAEQEATLREFFNANPGSIQAQVALAAMLSGQNRTDDALKVLATNNNEPLIQRQRIEIEIVGGRLADAEKELQTALANNPNPSLILLDRQAFLYMKTGRPTQALQVIESVLAKDPSDTEALFFRGSIYVAARRNLDQAIKDLQAVQDGQFNPLQARLLLASAYRANGDPDSATRELEDAVRLFPADKSARLALMDAYSQSVPPRWSQVERTLADARTQPALANDPDLAAAEAQMWINRKDPDKALAAISPALKVAAQNPNVLRVYCQAMIDARQYQPLLTNTDPISKDGKGPWWIYQFRGKALKRLDKKTEALNEFSTGIDAAMAAHDDDAVMSVVGTIADEIGTIAAKSRIFDAADKGNNHLRLIMSYLCSKDNDLQGALDWVNRITQDPAVSRDDLTKAQGVSANLYMQLDPPQVAKAVEVYRKMLENDPNDIASLNNLACAMISDRSGYTAADALPYSTKALQILQQTRPDDPVMPYILDTQGYVMVLNGQLAGGINLLQSAINLQPIPEACYHLGDAYLRSQPPQNDLAVDSLTQAQKLLEASTADNKPVDAELKTKIDAALARARSAVSSATTTP